MQDQLLQNQQSADSSSRQIMNYETTSLATQSPLACAMCITMPGALPNFYVTGTGTCYLPLTSKEGDAILIKCIYSASAEYTIISPTTITRQNDKVYTGKIHHINTREGQAYLQIIHEDGINRTIFHTYMEGGL